MNAEAIDPPERLTRLTGPERTGYGRSKVAKDLRALEPTALPGVRFDLSRLF